MSARRRAPAPIGRLAAAAIALGLLPAVTACEAGNNAPVYNFHPQSDGENYKFHGIHVDDAFVLGARIGAKIPAGRSAGLFLALYDGAAADKLVNASSSAATSVVLPKGGISLQQGQAVYLTGPRPAITLRGLTSALAGGTWINVTLDFRNAGNLTMAVPILPRANQYVTFSPAPTTTPSPASTRHSRSLKPVTSATPSPSASAGT